MTDSNDSSEKAESTFKPRVTRRAILGTTGAYSLGVFSSSTAGAPTENLVTQENGLEINIRQVSRPDFPQVNIFASVRNNGTPVTDLDQSNFTITEDGTSQTIADLVGGDETNPESISVSLVLDRSISMGGGALVNAKDAAKQFVNQFSSEDEGLIIDFGNSVNIQQRWTRNQDTLKTAIDNIRLGGSTALWDATSDGVAEAAPRPGRSAVIALTDGGDNRSRTSLDALIDEAQQSNVPVYTIGLGSGINEDDLTNLANETGGDFYTAPDSSDLVTIYNQISQSIANEYELSYETTNSRTDGQERQVTVDVTSGGTTATDSASYFEPCAPLPTAVFTTSPGSASLDQELTFDASASDPNGGQLVAYNWDFNNNGVVDATGESVTHTYTEPGTYQARLTVEKQCGASDTVIQEFAVTPTQHPVSILETNAPVTAGETLDVTVEMTNRSGSFSSQTLSVAVDTLGSAADVFSLEPAETVTETFEIDTEAGDAGTYTVVAESSDEGRDSVDITITEDEGVTLPITVQPSLPVTGEEITFDATAVQGDITAYSWEFGDGDTASGDVVTHVYTEPGQYEVTLTIEREGTTETGTTTIAVADEDDLGDAGITAAFDHAPRVPALGQAITFDASASTGPIDTYVWEFGDGTTDSGVQTEHQYDTPGEYTVTLRVGDQSGTAVATADLTDTSVVLDDTDTSTAETAPTVSADLSRTTLTVTDGDPFTGFTVSETEPTTAQEVSFSSGLNPERVLSTPGLRVQWDFGDGDTAEGAEAIHSYESAGTYTVTMRVQGNTTQREITVSQAPVEITTVDRRYPGTLLPEVGITDTFNPSIETRGDSQLDYVEYELTGRSQTVDTRPYAADYEIDDATAPGEQLQIRAVTTGDAIHEVQETVPIQPLPDWARTILDIVGDLSVSETEDGGLEITYDPLEQFDFIFTIPGDTLGGDDNTTGDDDQQFNFDANVGATYDPFTNTATISAAAGGQAQLLGTAEAALELEADGQITNLELIQLTAEPDVEVSVIPRTLGPIPLSIPLPPDGDNAIGVEPEITVQLGGTFNFDGEIEFEGGTVEPTLSLAVLLGFDVEIPFSNFDIGEVTGGPTGTVDTAFDVGSESLNFRGTFILSGQVTVEPPWPWGGVSIEGTLFERDLVGGGVSSRIRPAQSMIKQPTIGGTQPLPAIPSVDARDRLSTATFDTAMVPPRDAYRLSDRPFADDRPAVAAPSTDEQFVAWGRQEETKTVEAGHDIVGRWRRSGTWESPVSVTDDDFANVSPVAATLPDGQILVMWQRLTERIPADADLTERPVIDEYRQSIEIAYRIYDGTAWGDLTVVTDTDRVERKPTVAAGDAGWVLAWQSLDIETGDSRVRSVRVDAAGDATAITDRESADLPATGSRQDGAVDLVYLTEAAGGRQFVHERRTADAIQQLQTYRATDAVDVAVADGRLIWVENPRNDPSLIEAENGETTDLSLRSDAAEVDELTLITQNDRAILTYLSVLEDSQNRDQVYRLDLGNGWIRDRRVAGDTDETVAFRHTDATFISATQFITAYSIRERDSDAVSDVFATIQDFAPAYALDAAIGSGRAGEETTIQYTVENRGDTDGTTPVVVEIQRDGELLRTNRLSPLPVGDTRTETTRVTVGSGGEFTVTVRTDEPTLETEQRTVQLVAATPALRVGRVSSRRVGSTEAEVTVPIENPGGAAVDSVPVTVRDGAGELETRVIDRIPADSTASLELTVDPTELDFSDEHRVVIDPDDTLPEAAVAVSIRDTFLVRPNLRVAGLRFRRDSEGPFVRAIVANLGPGDGTGSMTVRAGNATEQIDLDIAPATVGPTGEPVPTYVQLDVRVSSLAAGQPVTVRIEPTVNDLDPASLQRQTTVASVLPGEYQGNDTSDDPLAPYRGTDGKVTTSGLRRAIDDWRANEISTSVLRDVIDAWRRG